MWRLQATVKLRNFLAACNLEDISCVSQNASHTYSHTYIMKSSEKVILTACFAIFAIMVILIFGIKQAHLSVSQIITIIFALISISVLFLLHHILVIRETFVLGAHDEAYLNQVARGKEVKVISVDILPTIPWYLGGFLKFKKQELAQVYTCIWVDGIEINIVRITRTSKPAYATVERDKVLYIQA